LNQSSAATQTETAEVKILVSVAGFGLLETEIQKWGTNLVSTVRTRKYKKRTKLWSEQMFVRFNYLIKVAIFHATLGYRMDVSAVLSAAGLRNFSNFFKRSDWLRGQIHLSSMY
jgi:hypothetical protein